MRYADLLRDAVAQLTRAKIPDARLEAELLLAEARGLSRASLLAHLDEPADAATGARGAAWLARRCAREPFAYIVGRKAFYGLDFAVDFRVLIPRPETERLVECALAWLARRRGNPLVVDVGTGSGAIAVALAVHAPAPLRLRALDASTDALAVARANAARHGVSARIAFAPSDLLAALTEPADLLIANLPYVSHPEWSELAPDIARYEPRGALDGGPDGLAVFRRFWAQAPARLSPGGAVMLEIGCRQGAAVSDLAGAAFPRADVRVTPDDAGLDRYVITQT